MGSSHEHFEFREDSAAGRVKGKNGQITDAKGKVIIRNSKSIQNYNTQGRLAKLMYGNS
jgi:hypothetical protein